MPWDAPRADLARNDTGTGLAVQPGVAGAISGVTNVAIAGAAALGNRRLIQPGSAPQRKDNSSLAPKASLFFGV
jgi:hypothetical protein